jgi:LCP family protein required for cell wall assembly
LATFLSFLWPGLGQWYGGRTRAAVLFAVPVIGVVLLLLITAAGGLGQLAALLLTPSSALTVVILIGLLAVWRLLSMADALKLPGLGNPWRNVTTATTFTVLAVITIAVHGVLGYTVYAFYDASSKIFVADTSPEESAVPSILPGATLPPDDDYVAAPIATPETTTSRINVLLTGVDSAETRSTALTDTLLVASIDPETADVVLISFPRDISDFELYDGRTYTGKINSFMTWVKNHESDFDNVKPLNALIKQIGFMLGAPIHYYAAIDLAGFRRMIDLVGGVTIDNPRAIVDPRYDWLDGTHGFYLDAGKHKLNGRNALAYVRSRQGVGDSDFSRARRQQQVLLALRSKLTSASMLPELPDILKAAGDTVRTNFPSERVAEMIDLAGKVKSDEARQYVLGPSKYAERPPYSETGGIYKLHLKVDALAKLSIDIFGNASRYAQLVSEPPSPAP